MTWTIRWSVSWVTSARVALSGRKRTYDWWRHCRPGGVDAAVVVRAIGPSLADFGVSDACLIRFSNFGMENGNVIAMNDNWETDPPPDNYSAEVTAAGLAPVAAQTANSAGH